MSTPNDPLYPDQWHFALLGGIETVWNEVDGSGVSVGIYDDGVQYTHPDLAANYDASLHFVSASGVEYDPFPKRSTHGHGTSVAGLAGSVTDNGKGVSGVAPGIAMTGVNFIEDLQYRSLDLSGQALRWAANFDIMNNSWGITPRFAGFQNLADRGSTASWFESQFADIAATGRGGLGTVIVQAAGNDGMDANGDGNNVSRYTITVAATDPSGYFEAYANYGPSLLVAAPAASVTTDLTGSAGDNGIPGQPDYTDEFSGTSAATPIVSGVVALMLEANPGLGWRDVQNILALSAAQTGAPYGQSYWMANGAEIWNGGGVSYNTDYGFGLVDAYAAVRMAEAWALFSDTPLTSANERNVRASYDDAGLGPVAIPDRSGATFGEAVVAIEVSQNIRIENIQVTLELQHRYAGDLRAYLVAPGGEEYTILDNNGAAPFDQRMSWTFEVTAALGMASAGTWAVRFLDSAAGFAGTAYDVTLDFYGAPFSPDDVHHFTGDFLDLRRIEPERGTLDDTNGGSDWLNLAAIAGDIALDLGLGGLLEVDEFLWAEIEDGAQFENAVAGDGDDRLVGNDLANALFGGRGDDQIFGLGGDDLLVGGPGDDDISDGDGDDTLRGEAGDDLFHAGDGADAYDGGEGFDVVDFGEAGAGVIASLATGGSGGIATGDSYTRIEALAGSRHADILTGDDLANRLDGREGDDEIDGAGGDDTIIGGAGNDTLRGGAGDDTFIAGPGADDHDGGEGFDVVDFGEAGAGVIASLATGGSGGIATGDRYARIEALLGSRHADILAGDAEANTIDGREGDDLLSGGAGDDRLIGGDGDDTLHGGDGHDTFIAGPGADHHDGGDGIDTVDYADAPAAVVASLAAGGSAGIAAGDSFVSVENLVGSRFGDVLTGDAGANRIEGGDGDDILSGGAGADVLVLGAGRDEVHGTLEELFGDTIADFAAGDAIVFLDQRIDREAIEVSNGPTVLSIDADGDTRADGAITLLGAFDGGDFMAALSGTSTRVSFERFLPELGERVSLDARHVNGIANQAYLTGDGLTGFRVSLDATRSAAGFDNSLGVYEIDGAGRIVDVRLLVGSRKADPSAVVDVTGVEAGHELGFFLVQNGADWSSQLADTDVFAFVGPAGGAPATVAGGAGLQLAVNGVAADVTVFHGYGESLNDDGLRHAVSGVDPGGALVIGFEDMTGGGDRDYQDLVFSVSLFDIA